MILLAEGETACLRNKFGTQRNLLSGTYYRLTAKVEIRGLRMGTLKFVDKVVEGADGGGGEQESQFIIMQQRKSPKLQTIKEDDSNGLGYYLGIGRRLGWSEGKAVVVRREDNRSVERPTDGATEDEAGCCIR